MYLCKHQALPVLAKVVEWWGRITGLVGVLYRHWKGWPGEQLLVLGETATEGLTGSDGLKRDLDRQKKQKILFSIYHGHEEDFILNSIVMGT